jgi:SAM-dependent methyltransferase
MTTGEFSDPRLVAVYETINAYRPGTQPDFYSWLAAEIGATTIVDVGCGSGLVTRQLAREGYRMIGIDPAPAMILLARRGADAEKVEWICGDVSKIGRPGADLAFMSGHVAQFFLTNASWATALVALHGALRPGARLAFESRNPEAREWERWTPARRMTVSDPTAGSIETWSEFENLTDGIVSYSNHYVFAATGDEVVVQGTLRFRTLDELTQSLGEAGFTVDRVYGDWDRRPADTSSRELIVVAIRGGVDI